MKRVLAVPRSDAGAASSVAEGDTGACGAERAAAAGDEGWFGPAGGRREGSHSSRLSRIAGENDQRAALDAALSRLPERHRQVIRMWLWDQVSFAQIGVAREVSQDAARMLYTRDCAAARVLLRTGHDLQ